MPNYRKDTNTRARTNSPYEHIHSCPIKITVEAHDRILSERCQIPPSWHIRCVKSGFVKVISVLAAITVDVLKQVVNHGLRGRKKCRSKTGTPADSEFASQRILYLGWVLWFVASIGGCVPGLIRNLVFKPEGLNRLGYFYPSLKIEKLSSLITSINLRNLS